MNPPLWTVEESGETELAAVAQSWLKPAAHDSKVEERGGNSGGRSNNGGGSCSSSDGREAPLHFTIPTAAAGETLGERNPQDYSRDSLEGNGMATARQ